MSTEGKKNIKDHLLLAPEDAKDGGAAEGSVTKMDVDGTTYQFDALGPMVVNSDGTLSRITNWQEMTEEERMRTLRVLAKRNGKRVLQQKLKEHGGESLSIAP